MITDMKTTFLIDELFEGVLIPLRQLLSRVVTCEPYCCSMRNLTVRGQVPFSLDVATFEKLTNYMDLGFIISHQELMAFAESDIEIQDGTFNFYRVITECIDGSPYLELHCLDSSFWEIVTDSEELIRILKDRGFVEREACPTPDSPPATPRG